MAGLQIRPNGAQFFVVKFTTKQAIFARKTALWLYIGNPIEPIRISIYN